MLAVRALTRGSRQLGSRLSPGQLQQRRGMAGGGKYCRRYSETSRGMLH